FFPGVIDPKYDYSSNGADVNGDSIRSWDRDGHAEKWGVGPTSRAENSVFDSKVEKGSDPAARPTYVETKRRKTIDQADVDKLGAVLAQVSDTIEKVPRPHIKWQTRPEL
ncbi:MAG: hypothetical protein ACREGF_06890, partial [Candidatus Saccharimonadales bacterium]